ncbi:MAG: CoA transferase, partial [Dehalococcoidia bacterium]|nr:CoA transferase [Dehalococcoidia bacterium]
MSKGVLDGIRVVDWTLFHQGPAGGMYLAALGADVIHVEQRGVGDVARGSTTVSGVSMSLPGDRNLVFEELNTNKRGISLDLTKQKGREIMYRLVEKSDVFITNYRTQAVEKLVLDYETLRRRNPKLVYGHATTYGERGPEKDSPGLELAAYARSGSMFAAGQKGDPPVYLGLGAGDRLGGVFLAFGAISALLARERTGTGQYYSTSQLGAMISLFGLAHSTALFTGKELRIDQRSKAGPLYNVYQCRDGQWLALAMVIDPDRFWPDFCRAIDRPELADDPEFDSKAKREENKEALVAILDRVFATRDCEEWERKLKMGGDFIFSRVNSLTQAIKDPQILANEYIVDFDHPEFGRVKQVAFPIHFSETPASIHSPA